MSMAKGVRAIVAGCLASTLAGCALFAPPYDATLDQKTTSAYEGVAKLSAEAEMGLYQDKSTYSGKIETYAEIQAALAVAAIRAGSAPTGGKGAEKARELTVRQIKSCAARVSTVAAEHSAKGLAPAAGETGAMMSSCDLAARAVRAMKN